MAGFIAKQPNGLYCRFSTIVDCPTHINMTEEDYLNNVIGTVLNREAGLKVLEEHLQPFHLVTDKFIPNNMTERAFELLLRKVNDDEQSGYEIT